MPVKQFNRNQNNVQGCEQAVHKREDGKRSDTSEMVLNFINNPGNAD